MIIVWGWAEKRRQFGAVEQRHCGHCGGEQAFRTRVIYTMRHIMFLARWVTDRRYARICQACYTTEYIPLKTMQKGLSRPGIPLFDRFAWVAGVALVASSYASIVLTSEDLKRQDLDLLAAPAARDLYEIDLAQVQSPDQAPVMWAVVRVETVTADKVTVRLPNIFYDGHSSELTDAMAPDGAGRSDSYYSEDRLDVSRAALKTLRSDDTIWSVAR